MRYFVLGLMALPLWAQSSVYTVLGNSSPYTDSTGQVWAASNGCNGGTSNSTTNAIVGSGPDPTIYQHNLTSTSAFACTYAVNQNTYYNVTLKFANITSLTIGQYVFNVYINNTIVRSNLDIATLTASTPGVAGVNRASDLGFTVPVGTLAQVSINLVPTTGGAMVNAISIVGVAAVAPNWIIVSSFFNNGSTTTCGIQEALNMAGNNGTVYIPASTCTIPGTSSITIPAGVSLVGAGIFATTLISTSGTGNLITTIGASTISDFTVTLTGATSRNCIEVDSFGFGLINRVTCNGGQDGIRVNLGAGNSNFTDIQINNQSRNGVFVNADSSGEVRFTRVRVQQASLAAGATGFLITKTGTVDLGGIYLNDCLANSMGTGLFFNSSMTPGMPLWVANSVFDVDNVGVNLVNTGSLKIIGSWINSNGISNSLILNNIANFNISTNKILGVGSAGIQFLGTDTNGTITGNDMSQTGTAFLFTSSPTVTGVLFRGNIIGSATLTNSAALLATASAGVPYLTDGPERSSQLNLSAAAGAVNLIASAPAGQYRFSWYIVVTQAATTSSGVQVNFVWNDGTAAQIITSTNLTTNTLGAYQSGSIMITNAAAQTLAYSTNYASVGATPMKYSIYVTLEML